MKKIISVILVIAVMVTGIIGLVACQNDSLDGRYKSTDGEWYLVLNDNSIKLYFKDNMEEEGTFTRKGDKLTTTIEGYENITVLDNGDLINHTKTIAGNDLDETYKKVTE